MDYQEFVSKDKSLVIAPAGFGKTHSLALCLNHTPEDEKQLILTHTHAGVASIKEKIKSINIRKSKYHIETITGFAQKYVLSYYCKTEIPPQEDTTNYFPFIIKIATDLFDIESIQRIITNSYNGLFVDEYQDCTIEQHNLILKLSNILPTHILGDPMQGIFDFTGTLVSFDEDLDSFEELEPLTTPWRWIKTDSRSLGSDLTDIRNKLKSKETIDLSSYTSIEFYKCEENDWCFPRTEYRNCINRLLSEDSLLIIHPESSTIHPRVRMIKSFKNRLSLIESIDSKDFYQIAKLIDEWDHNFAIQLVKDLSYKLFSKTGLDNWFNAKGFKRKNSDNDKLALQESKQLVEELQINFNFNKLISVLYCIKELPKVICYRKNLFYSICKALETAYADNKCVYDGMVDHRNLIRRVGKKYYTRCIGTTLLTKGLEFDTVAIINAHKFDNYKHFYVAITRASNKLIIFSNSETIDFNYE